MTPYEAQARELLPCSNACGADECPQLVHVKFCPASYRPTIAAALQKVAEEARVDFEEMGTSAHRQLDPASPAAGRIHLREGGKGRDGT